MKADIALLHRDVIYEFGRFRHRLFIWAVWRLPKNVVMWCGLRIIADATTGVYSATVVKELTAMDALDRWETNKGGDKSNAKHR